jgi:hypothetical protein
MSYFDLKTIYYQDKTTDDGEIIDDVKDISISIGSELKNNNMKITLHNNQISTLPSGTIRHRWVDNEGNAVFSAVRARAGDVISEEFIDVYCYYTDTNPDAEIESNDYLLFSGAITEGSVQYEEKQTVIKLKTKDRSSVALDKTTIPTPFEKSEGWNTPTVAKEIIRNAAQNNTGGGQGFDYNGGTVFGTGWLIDARLFSESIKSSGNLTSVSSKTITDSGATFVTDGVNKDDWIRNTNTEQYAYIASVDSETQLTLTKPIFSSGDSYQVSDGFIQDTRPDGTEFPPFSFAQLDKPVYESLSTITKTENTNTTLETDPDTGSLVVKRGMRYFIDNLNRLHMYIPSDTPELIMELGQTTALSYDERVHDIYKIELKNSVDDVINYIIFRAGEDMDNDMIRSFHRVPFSGEPNTKECVRHWLHVALNMKHEAYKKGEITWVSGTEFNYPTSYNPLPTGSDYPAWWSGQTSGAEAYPVPTNDNDYNDMFKKEAIRRGRAKAQEIFNRQANPLWKGNIEIRGEPIIVGDLILFTSKPHGVRDVKLRVTGVSHNINASTGWVTSLSVEEDEVEADKMVGN